jgi:hypothetical protein
MKTDAESLRLTAFSSCYWRHLHVHYKSPYPRQVRSIDTGYQRSGDGQIISATQWLTWKLRPRLESDKSASFTNLADDPIHIGYY